MYIPMCDFRKTQYPCKARRFALLRNSLLSSIHIHFGVELLVLTALVTSDSLSKRTLSERPFCRLWAESCRWPQEC